MKMYGPIETDVLSDVGQGVEGCQTFDIRDWGAGGETLVRVYPPLNQDDADAIRDILRARMEQK